MTKRKHPNTAAGRAASKAASPWSRGPNCNTAKARESFQKFERKRK